MEGIFSFLGNAASSVANIFTGGGVKDILTKGATTLVKNRLAGGGSTAPSLLTKPQSLGTESMSTYSLDAPKETATPEVADYEKFLLQWEEIMKRFARYN
jgi:hypothetical protein